MVNFTLAPRVHSQKALKSVFCANQTPFGDFDQNRQKHHF